MIRLDQMFAHQRLDRMVNRLIKDRKKIHMKTIHEYAAEHQSVLERRRALISSSSTWPRDWDFNCESLVLEEDREENKKIYKLSL